MSFAELLQRVIHDTLGEHSLWSAKKFWNASNVFSFSDGSLLMFSPELILVAAILLLLFVRLFGADRRMPGSSVALSGAVLALLISVLQAVEIKTTDNFESREFFTGLLVYDQFTVFFRQFLLLFLVLVIYLTKLSGIPDQEDAPDFYILLLGSTIGMMLMASANHLLILFLGIEITSVPSYAMVGFLKGRRLSSEAALKYVVYGAGAAGVMLYGISLLAGLMGTADMPEIAQQLSKLVVEKPRLTDPTVATLVVAILFIFVGFAFKLSVFPFHFWCPDAFEGASAEVAGFLSVASKAAAFALLIRFCLALTGGQDVPTSQLTPVYMYLGIGLGAVAAATATFGNLAAYAQNNMKRLLAYSTIAHAGYMLMAVAALLVILNAPRPDVATAGRVFQAERCIEGLLYYLWVYLFMNLGAFAIVALIRNEIFSEDIHDYAGLVWQAPVLAVAMGICMFSLVGIPPFGGFIGKFMVFASLYQAGFYHWSMWAVLVIGGLNTVFSLFYYVRVLKTMIISAPHESKTPIRIEAFSRPGLYVAGISFLVLLTGVWVDPLSRTVHEVASIFFP